MAYNNIIWPSIEEMKRYCVDLLAMQRGNAGAQSIRPLLERADLNSMENLILSFSSTKFSSTKKKKSIALPSLQP